LDIAIVIPKLDSIGGGEKFLIECMKRWQKKHELTLYTTSLDKRLLKEYKLDINLTKLTKYVKNDRLELLTLPFEMKRLQNQIDGHEIYNFHSFPTNLVNKHPSIWIPQEPPRILYDLQPFFFKNPNTKFYKKLMGKIYFPILRYINERYTVVDEIIANSYYSKRYLENVYKQKVNSVIYPGVDWESFKYRKSFSNVILTVNRLHPEKRVDLAIKAMKHLDKQLWIIGDGFFRSNLEKLTEKLKLKDKVKFLGTVSESTLRNLYSKCFCIVYTPIREPFGMVALESMAAGKPVIGCDVGGFTEIIENGKHGFLIKDPNPKKIAEKIIYLSNNQDIYDSMCKNCRKKSKEYSWEKTANQLLKVFKNY